MAVGVITMLAGIAVGGVGERPQAGSHTAGSHAADYVTGTTRP